MKVMQKIAAVACSTALVCSMGAGVAMAAAINGSATSNTLPAGVSKGDTTEFSNGSTYAVNSSTKATVSYSAPKSTTIKTAVLRTTVHGFKVTGITKTAFKGCKNLKTVKVESSKVSASSVKAAIMQYTYTKKNVKTIKVPKSQLAKYQKAFKGTGIKVKAI